ncbi:hypothetical protein JCM3765_007415 [Sporobolomyces pararoseus]
MYIDVARNSEAKNQLNENERFWDHPASNSTYSPAGIAHSPPLLPSTTSSVGNQFPASLFTENTAAPRRVLSSQNEPAQILGLAQPAQFSPRPRSSSPTHPILQPHYFDQLPEVPQLSLPTFDHPSEAGESEPQPPLNSHSATSRQSLTPPPDEFYNTFFDFHAASNSLRKPALSSRRAKLYFDF